MSFPSCLRVEFLHSTLTQAFKVIPERRIIYGSQVPPVLFQVDATGFPDMIPVNFG